MLTYREAASEVMWHLITCPNHGYSQYARDGNGEQETFSLSDETQVTIADGDRDCSSAAINCYESIGVSCGGASYTGNMESGMLGSGNFIEISPWDADNGDVLLRTGHTEMALRGYDGELYQGGFRISELGTIYGEVGDQTGWESTYSAFNPDAWEQAFRCVAERNGSTTPTQKEGDDEMTAIIRPDQKEFLIYVSGGTYRRLTHPDQAEAVRMAYKTCTGRDIPQFELGSPDDPWGTRLMEALKEV